MSALPYAMFDLPRSAEDARRYARVENIYHRGQDLAWDGREVLAGLFHKHGDPRFSAAQREALWGVFGPRSRVPRSPRPRHRMGARSTTSSSRTA